MRTNNKLCFFKRTQNKTIFVFCEVRLAIINQKFSFSFFLNHRSIFIKQTEVKPTAIEEEEEKFS